MGTMIALPHLIFGTVLWVAGFLAWVTNRKWPWSESAAAIPAAVIAGLGAAYLLAMWGV